MYVCVCVCVCVYIYTHTHTHTHTHIHRVTKSIASQLMNQHNQIHSFSSVHKLVHTTGFQYSVRFQGRL